MDNRVSRGLASAAFPLLIGFTFLAFSLIYYSLGFPGPERIQQMVISFFDQYGLYAVFFAAFLEALFVLSFYFPGSLVIVLAVLASTGSLRDLGLISISVGLGALAGVWMDYFIGRFGLHSIFAKIGGNQALRRAESWHSRWGRWSILLFGFHPNALSILCTHAGITKVPFSVVVSMTILSLAFWTPVAVLLVHLLVDQVSATSENQHWYIFGVFIFWALLAFIFSYFRGDNSNVSS